MAKKVFIGVGHGGTDPGAAKYVVEKDVNLTMALACKELLEANDVIVKMSRTKDENDPLADEIKECKAFNPDLAVDIHNNAGGGDGFEAYHSRVGGLGKTLAQNLEAEVKKLGQNSRGVKTKLNDQGKDYYGFIRSTKCHAVIVEGVFVDNATDVQIADTVAEQKEFGYAYARGILKTLGIKEKKVEPFKPFTVRVSISNLHIRKGAGYKKYASKGMIPKGVYTIVETVKNDGYTWGKLKSGAGWIALEYTTRL